MQCIRGQLTWSIQKSQEKQVILPLQNGRQALTSQSCPLTFKGTTGMYTPAFTYKLHFTAF